MRLLIAIAVLCAPITARAMCGPPASYVLPGGGPVGRSPDIYVFAQPQLDSTDGAIALLDGAPIQYSRTVLAETDAWRVTKLHFDTGARGRILLIPTKLEPYRFGLFPVMRTYEIGRFASGPEEFVESYPDSGAWTCSSWQLDKLHVTGGAIVLRLEWRDDRDRTQHAWVPIEGGLAEVGRLNCTGTNVPLDDFDKPREVRATAIFPDGIEQELGVDPIVIPPVPDREERNWGGYREDPTPWLAVGLGASAAVLVAGTILIRRRRRKRTWVP
ncbi:MAG TPA: hypothetical protein VL463_00550 [Kofleriaceae bacterium]|jgi:hypothetical protein|nr:hypothetical protein [Kofleriaceae bacterium]